VYKALLAIAFLAMAIIAAVAAQKSSGEDTSHEKDTIKTAGGDLEITFIGHGTLMLAYAGKIIHVDPYSCLTNYAKLPKADLILITHHHGDHLDLEALEPIRTDKTVVVHTEKCTAKVKGGVVMDNGDSREEAGITIDAVPAYNVEHTRDNGEPYHVKGEGNGYVLTFGDTRVYIAGDTENIPEMEELEGIECAFLPMNLPYTMTPEMVAEAAKVVKPKVLYPYHFGDTETSKLVELLEDASDMEVRIRDMT
jgi:L-ascorbate metabolism protein UlaG (beta-lactamase superfamily)